MRGSQVTIKDIARELKISPSTVSRALKNHPDISKKTKAAVNELAQKYGYRRNPIALSLLQSKSNIIGVVIPEIVHFFFSSIISGIEDVASRAGYNVMICQSNESYEREIETVQALSASRVDGLLISVSKNTYEFDHLKDLENVGIPVVFFDRVCQEIDTHKVVIDDFNGAFQAVEHLISIGRKRIAHLSGPQNLLIGKKRLEGYLHALKKHDLPIDENLIINCDTFDKALKSTPALYEMDNPPDAIF
ncbi:MAG: LacI family DNA-binding transcriptional regulator, partial [Bacteroidota bacterium]|nr:LacI family DNA-binding transcriptional regulator [Bacteroidota bacterium]